MISPPPQDAPSCTERTIHAACYCRHRLHVLIRLSMPIVFCARVAASLLWYRGLNPMQQLSFRLGAGVGIAEWVLLSIPASCFAGNLMERCGMTRAVELARALIVWVGGRGMSV